MRRFAMLALSLSLLLGLSGTPLLFAQGDAKKDAPKAEPKKDAPKAEPKKDAPKAEPKKDAPKAEPKKDAPKAEPKKDAPKAEPKKDAPKAEPKKDEAPKEEPLAPIPPEVQKKLEAARRAVAEAIVACQDAGLVKTTIDPPPILDILITGRATDESTLKSKKGVSPEVFGAWFTGYGKPGVNLVPLNDIRIIQPSNGLKDWYDQRAALLTREIDAVRKANGSAEAAKKAKDDAAKNEQMKKDDAAKKEKEVPDKKDDAAKKEQMKKDDAAKKEKEVPDKKDDAAKKEQMKKDDAAKKEKEAADKTAKEAADKKDDDKK